MSAKNIQKYDKIHAKILRSPFIEGFNVIFIYRGVYMCP